jgi:hypothetical protein
MNFADALASANALVTLAKTALDARDDAKAKQAVGELSEKLFNLSMASLDMAERLAQSQSTNHDLAAQLRAAEGKLAERMRYQLTPLGRGGRAYVLAEDDPMHTPGEPTYFCQHCRDKGIQSILRHFAGTEWSGASWCCVENDSHNLPA